jgi:thiamine-monophosphate kinase
MEAIPVSSKTENELIGYIQSLMPPPVDFPNDDAAMLGIEAEERVIAKDLLLEGVHFDLRYVPARHLGFKSIAVNISDIAAMNATPESVLLGLGLPANLELSAFEELVEGIAHACRTYNVALIGGDISLSKSGLIISVTALGKAPRAEIRGRSGAKPNQLICVSGNVGAAVAGFLLLQREQKLFEENPKIQPDLSEFPYLIERQLKPEPRLDIIQQLANAGCTPDALIDISDGLATELIHICKASGVGCRIDAARIPIDPETLKLAAEMNLDPYQLALYGGEDYELLFTCPAEWHEKVSKIPDITIIGYTLPDADTCVLVDDNLQQHPLSAMGWDSFGGTGAANVN